MGAIRKHVKRQIRGAKAGNVRRLVNAFRKHDPRGSDAGTLGFLQQIAARQRQRHVQPEYRLRCRSQGLEPDAEELARQLVALVEAREHDGALRQPERGPRQRFRKFPVVVVDLVAAWQAQHPLVKVLLVGLRNDDVVGDNAVDRVASQRPGKAEVVQLQRCRAMREDAQARTLRVPLQVDQDVDAIVAYPSGRGGIVERGNLRPRIDGGPDAAAHRAVVVRAVAVHADVEPASVVAPEETCH